MKQTIIWAFFLYLGAGLIDVVLAMCGIPGAGMLAIIVVATMLPVGFVVALVLINEGWKESERERIQAERDEWERARDAATW